MRLLARLVVAATLLIGCEGPSVPSVVEGEPVCKDFKQANETLKGGLKHPVRLKINEGKTLVATVMLYGIPESSNVPTRFLLPDSNADYSLEWAQCKVPRAPTSFDPRDRDAKRQAGQSGGSYDCAEADVYETTKHSTKKGDPASHKIAMVAPPDVECW